MGWTSIYQLFWGSLGTRVLTHPHMCFHFKSSSYWGTPILGTPHMHPWQPSQPLSVCLEVFTGSTGLSSSDKRSELDLPPILPCGCLMALQTAEHFWKFHRFGWRETKKMLGVKQHLWSCWRAGQPARPSAITWHSTTHAPSNHQKCSNRSIINMCLVV